MSGELDQFHDIFFEEADELIFDPDDPEKVNTVVRAARSIIGGQLLSASKPSSRRDARRRRECE
jgi:hypothetical protein